MRTRFGARVWIIPDGFYPSASCGEQISHDAVCVLNPGKRDAHIKITLYFEDRDKMEGFHAVCGAERTNHIRMDKIRDGQGNGIPKDIPYAMVVNSDVDIVVQYSRMDTRQAEMALMTTMAFPIE